MSHSEGMEYASTYARLAATELTLLPALALALAVSFALGLARMRTLISPCLCRFTHTSILSTFSVVVRVCLMLAPSLHCRHIEESRADGKGCKVGKEKRGDAAGHKARTRLCWRRRCSWWRRRCSACWVWHRCLTCDQGRSGLRIAGLDAACTIMFYFCPGLGLNWPCTATAVIVCRLLSQCPF